MGRGSGMLLVPLPILIVCRLPHDDWKQTIFPLILSPLSVLNEHIKSFDKKNHFYKIEINLIFNDWSNAIIDMRRLIRTEMALSRH